VYLEGFVVVTPLFFVYLILLVHVHSITVIGTTFIHHLIAIQLIEKNLPGDALYQLSYAAQYQLSYAAQYQLSYAAQYQLSYAAQSN
jgi:hypothetical protein